MAIGQAQVEESQAKARRLSRNLLWGVGMLAGLALLAALAPVIAPYSPTHMDANAPMAGPSIAHLFGTDSFGRDVLSRVLYGYRTSLAVAVGSVSLGVLGGVPLGLIAGFFGPLLDNVIMRIMDVVLAFPAILLAIALIGVTGHPNQLIVIVAIAVIYIPVLARVTRSATIAAKHELFVEGARAQGASEPRVLVRHVLPNAAGPIAVQAALLMGVAILIEAALSFIGLGTQPPQPSLGLMLANGRDIMTSAPWVVIFPGLAIVVAVLAFNLVGDGLAEQLSPR